MKLWLCAMGFGFCSNCIAELTTFNVYTSDESELSRIAFLRLEAALLPLKYRPTLINTSARRSIMKANSIGDAELIRVKNLMYLQPEFSSNLIRVKQPIIFSQHYAISLQPLRFKGFDIESIKQHRVGLQIGVFTFTQMFPKVQLRSTTEKLLDLVKMKKIDVAIVSNISVDFIKATNSNYSKNMHASLLLVEPLHLYLHQKHHKIADALSNSFLQYTTATD